MARGSQDSPPMSRFRAFTTALGFKPSGGMSRSSSDQSSTPSIPQRPVSMSSLRPLYGNFTLYLRVHSARNLSAVAQGSYCKLYLGDEPIIGGFGQGKSLVGADKKQGGSHQTFHTKVQMSAMRDCPEWNEKFQMNVKNPNAEILTIRVKNHVLIYSPAIGACVVYLRQLQLGETIDEWFPLYKNDKPSGEIRLQICMQENAKLAVPERRYSQASEETIQRLMLEHRELGEAQRRELELQQEEKWRKMEEDVIKHAGLEQQIEREKWTEQCASNLEHEQKQQEKEENSDSELPSSFKYRGVKKEEDVATQKMENLSLQTAVEESNQREVNFGVPSGYTIYGVDSGNTATLHPSRQLSSFGTIRLSVDELDQVTHNALPTSDSSESTSSEHERRRRRRKQRGDRKHSHRKKHSKRRVYSDDGSSDDSSISPRRPRKGSSRLKVPEEKCFKKRSAQSSVSSRSGSSNQYQSRHDPDVPVTLTFPQSPADKPSAASSSEDEYRRRRRQAEKAKRREKERRRRSKRKNAKSRRNYESSYSSSSLSPSSSSLSSSEEERLLRKLKKKKLRKARARAKLSESGGSRGSTQSSGMQYQHKLSYANTRNIDSVSPYLKQHWNSEQIEASGTQRDDRVGRPVYNDLGHHGDSPAANSSFVPSTTNQVHSSYGPDGVRFDEPDQSTIPQYLGQTTKEQTNAELMRSFCF
ncbi:C2 domain [Phytophthora cactorum]|nr:C2 domain [Phytophthora cactorum]